MLCASWLDYKERKIPDWLNALFLIFSLSASYLNQSLWLFLQAFVFSLLFSIVLYRLGAWGGGDAKFFAALCSFMPLFGIAVIPAVATVFILSALFLGVYVAVKLFFRKKPFTETLPVGKLREGMIPDNSMVRVGRKALEIGFFSRLRLKDASVLIADSLRAGGLKAGEIRLLKDSGVKYLRVREGVVFAPFLSLAFIVVVFA